MHLNILPDSSLRAVIALGVFNHGNIRVISYYRDDFSCFGIMKVAPLPKLDTEE